MPTYQYACAKCGEHPEVYQTFSEESLKRHNQCEGSKCTGKLQKVFSPVGIVLKGSGFYKTDSRSASRAASKASESKSDSTTSDTKTDAKSDTKKADAKAEATKTNGSSSSSSAKKSTAKPAKKSA